MMGVSSYDGSLGIGALVRHVLGLAMAGLTGATLACALLPSTARADDLAYMATSEDQFGIIDLNTGTFNQLGISQALLLGLGTQGGQLYGGAVHFYQVNPTNGSLTVLGTPPFNFFELGSTNVGLFALDFNLNLYGVNPANGATTLIGPTGLSQPPGGPNSEALSTGSSTLYFTLSPVNGVTPLYSLDTSNGAATFIGNTGTGAIGALVFENGTLYAGQNFSTGAIYRLNPATGASTFVASVSGNAALAMGFAPSAVPEPSTMTLLGTGLLIGIGMWRQRRGLRGGRVVSTRWDERAGDPHNTWVVTCTRRSIRMRGPVQGSA